MRHGEFKGVGLSESGHAGASRFFMCFSQSVKHAIESACTITPVNNAEQSLEITQVIEQIGQILFVQENATQFLGLASHYLNVKSAELNATNTEIDFVPERVRTLFKKDLPLLHSLVSTLEHKRQTHILSHALTVAILENTGTTLTIQNLNWLNGFASLVIENIITWENADQNLKSLPTRFLYSAKASKRERNAGLEGMPEKETYVGHVSPHPQRDKREQVMRANHHPTVKPQKLMEYLITMITPPNGIVLDPFMGSGSTGVAAKNLGFNFIGIEKEKEYYDICKNRMAFK